MSEKTVLWKKPSIHFLVYLVVTIALFWGFLIDGDKTLLSTDQFASLGAREYFKNALMEHKQFPTWNSSILSGMPTIDALYGDVLYFPMVIVKALLPIHRAFVFKMMIHIFLAGVFFYTMMRKAFRAPPLVAFAGGLFYMLNPQFFSHIYPGHDAKMYVISFLPIVVWRMKVLMEQPNIFNTSIMSALIGLTILTSHVQLAYFVMWGLFFYWVLFHILKIKKEKSLVGSAPSLVFFWVASFVGVAIAAVQLYPPMGFVAQEFSERGAGKGFEFAASWSLHWPEFFSLWVPEFGNTLSNYWSENPFKLNHEYTGAMPLLLAIIALIYKPKVWRLFWGGMALFTLLFSLGAHTPVFHIAYYLIPGVKKFRACSMIMAWFSFSTIILSALFLLDLSKRSFAEWTAEKRARFVKILWIAVAVVVGATVLFSMKGFVVALMKSLTPSLDDPKKYRIFDHNFSKNFVPFLWLWCFFAVTTLSTLVQVIKGKVQPTVFVLVVALIGLIDTVRINTIFIEPIPAKKYVYTEKALKPLQREMKQSPFRVLVLQGTYNQQNAAGVHDLEEITGFHDNELKWYKEFSGNGMNFYSGFVQGGRLVPDRMVYGNNFLALANMKYFIGRSPQGLLAIENQNTLGRLSLVPNYKVMKEEEIIPALKTSGYDIRKTVALLEEPSEKPVSTGSSSLTTKWLEYQPNYRKAEIECGSDGFLRLSEVYYPGWEVKIDGKKKDIYRADYSWMAVAVTKGKHTIEMYPHSLFLGKAFMVTATLVILLLLYWIWYGFNSFKKRKKELL